MANVLCVKSDSVISYHDGIPYAEVTVDDYGQVQIRLFTDKNVLSHGELLDLIEILQGVEEKL